MFIDTLRPPDFKESLKAAWEVAYRPNIYSYMATIKGRLGVPLIGRIRVHVIARPHLYIDTNPYVSLDYIQKTYQSRTDPVEFFREHHGSLAAFLNLAHLGLAPHDGTGVDNNQIILRLLGVETTGSEEYRNNAPFDIGFVNGPKQDHAAGLISISPYNFMLGDNKAQGQSPDAVLLFTEGLYQHLGLDIQPLDRSAFLRQVPKLLQSPK